jgi:putative phage-type endonuclease
VLQQNKINREKQKPGRSNPPGYHREEGSNPVTDKSIQVMLEKASKARLLGQFVSGSPEWHDARQNGIGGSDIGAICGVNKWDSPLSMWAKKLELVDVPQPNSEAMEWGVILEPVILAKFRREHPEFEVLDSPGTFAHPDRDWQLANPDALAYDKTTGEWVVVEIKTSRYEDDWDDKTGEVPPTYRAQVLWYLQTFGFHRAIVATLFSGSKYREFEIVADEFEMEANLQRAQKWWEYVESGQMPDFDGAEATYNTMRELHPDIDPEADSVELAELGQAYLNCSEEFDRAEFALREAKTRILDKMGNAKRGLLDGRWIVTRQARGTTGTPFLVNKKG